MGQSPSNNAFREHHYSKRRRSSDQSKVEFRNPLFGVRALERRTRRRNNREPCPPEFCNRVLELVKDGDNDSLECLLRDPPVPIDTPIVKDWIAGYYSDEGLTLFHYAAKLKSSAILSTLVEFCKDGTAAINLKSQDELEFTALHFAVKSGSLHCVLALIQHPYISLNEHDCEEWTPLHYACFQGHAPIVSALQTANFCARNIEGDYPLHLAASMHHVEVFAALRGNEAFMERCQTSRTFKSLQDADGNTLLNLAVDGGEEEIVEWCLEVNISLKKGNAVGMNSLHVAARRGCTEIARKLIEKVVLREGNVTEFLNSKNSYQATPLYMASKFNRCEMVAFLIEKGANIEGTNGLGFTPLLGAIRYTNLRCVKELLAHGASVLVRDQKRCFNALLWAVEMQNADILQAVVVHAKPLPEVWKQLWKEKDSSENTAHHIAAKARNLDILEALVHYNTSCLEERNKDGCTPLHIAVKEGKPNIVSYIISNAAGSTHSVDSHENTGLHLAAERGHDSIVERLVTVHSLGTSVCSRNSKGFTPIHLAALNGHHTVLGFLLEHSPRDAIEILDNEHCTSMYLACRIGHVKCVEVLLHWGAMVTYAYTYHGEKRKTSCLEIAIDKDHLAVVSAVLNSDRWQQALQYCDDTHAKDAETPFRKLIKKMPAASKLVFDRCVLKRKENDKKRGSYYYEVEYNYEFLEDFQNLFADQGPKFLPDPGISTGAAPPIRDEIYINDAVVSSAGGSPGTPMLGRASNGDRNVNAVPLYFQHHEPTAQRCDPYRSWGPTEYRYQNHPLHLMVYHKRQDLLKHPLVATFIHYKWNLFGRYVYYPNIITYIFLMLLLTIYMFLRFDYSKELAVAADLPLSDCSHSITSFDVVSNALTDCPSLYNVSLNESYVDELRTIAFANPENYSCEVKQFRETDDLMDQLDTQRGTLIVCSVIIILNCLVRIIIEIGQVIHHRGEYFADYINYLEGCLYVTTIIFVSNFQLNCLPSWQWQLGAVCIFLSWINFILFLSQQPTVGIYVVMFQDIIKTFLRMFPMSVLLILAFGQPFFMLLSTIETDQPPQQFVNFPYSLLKTIIMTIGEFETDPIFFSTPSVIEYPVATYMLWIIFLVIMPVLLQNMLVGLAVDDIKSVQEKAALKREALQIEFILDVMSRMPNFFIRWRNAREYTQTFGKGPIEKFRKWLTGSSWKPDFARKEDDLDHSVFLKMERMSESIISLEERMKFLAEQSLKLEKMMTHFAQEQERYLEPARQQALANTRRTFRSQPSLSRFKPQRREVLESDEEI